MKSVIKKILKEETKNLYENEDYDWLIDLEEILNSELQMDAVCKYVVSLDNEGIKIFFVMDKKYYGRFPNLASKIRLVNTVSEKIEKFMYRRFPIKFMTSVAFSECPNSKDIFESTRSRLNEDVNEIKEYMQYRVDLTIEKLRTHCDSFMAQFEDGDVFDFLSGDVDLCEYLRFVESVKVVDFEEEETDRRNFLTIYVKITLTDEKYYYSDFQATLLMEIENFIQNYFHTKVEILEAA